MLKEHYVTLPTASGSKRFTIMSLAIITVGIAKFSGKSADKTRFRITGAVTKHAILQIVVRDTDNAVFPRAK